MIFNVGRKQLWSVARMLLPGVGFTLACVGAYLASLQPELMLTVVPSYALIVVGALMVLVGVFWNICNSMKSKMYQRERHEQQIHVYTVERPSCFPPSYEESQGGWERREAVPESVVPVDVEDVVDVVDVAVTLAPPLYSRDSSDAPDCTWSWERPPRYSLVGRIQEEKVEVGEMEVVEASSEH